MAAKQRLSISKEQKKNLCLKISKHSNERDHFIAFHAYFLKRQKAQALHCILLKNTKVQTEKSQEEEMAVKEIIIPFATPVPIENTY